MYRKNIASQFFCFQGVDATAGGIKSGVTWTIRRCIDGTFAAAGGTVTEDGTTGWYKFAMSQADTNGNDISFNFTGTGAIPQTVNFVTTACDPTAATNFGITALPTTACTTNASLLTSGTGTDQLQVTAGLASANEKQINGVATTSVTTIAAVIGTTIAPTFTGSLIKCDVTDWNATAVATPATAGIPEVNVKNMNNVSAAAITTIKAVQGLAVDGVITTVTNQLTAAQVATGIWQDTTAGDFTTALSIGKSIMNGIALGSGLKIAECVLTDTLTTYTGNTLQTGDSFARLGAPAGASVSADIASIKTDTTAIGLTIIDKGTAQSGAASNIQLRAGAPDLGTNPRNLHVVITGGTGVTQVREVGGWTNATKTITLNTNWVTNPDVTSTYAVVVMTTLDNQGFPAHFGTLGIDAGGAITLVTEAQFVDEVALCDALTANNDKTGYSLAAGQLLVKKNAQLASFMFVLTDSTTHAPKTGVTVTATRSIDGAAFAACANAAAEVGNGWYKITLANTDLNGTVIALRFTGTSTDDRNFTFVTQA